MKLTPKKLTQYAPVRALFVILLPIGLLCSSFGCFSVSRPNAVLDAAAIAELKQFDYGRWSELLANYVDQDGKVDYQSLKSSRQPLDNFVALIGEVGPKMRPELFPDRAHQLAYYINGYNALTIFNVINRLPQMQSVNDSARSFFYFTKFRLDGEGLSKELPMGTTAHAKP